MGHLTKLETTTINEGSSTGSTTLPSKQNYSRVNIMVVGAGGAGTQAPPPGTNAGTAGGPSGGVTICSYPAGLLPTKLYFFPAPAIPYASTNPIYNVSYVSIANDSGGIVQNNVVAWAYSAMDGGTGGQFATAPPAASQTGYPFLAAANNTFIAGQRGWGPRGTGSPASVTPGLFVSGGAGGAGFPNYPPSQIANGYGFNALSDTIPGLAGGTGSNTGTGGNGLNGINRVENGFAWLGGTGGGGAHLQINGNAGGNGGNGGAGGIGCGGGGGGMGGNGGPNVWSDGNGGPGGPAYFIITFS